MKAPALQGHRKTRLKVRLVNQAGGCLILIALSAAASAQSQLSNPFLGRDQFPQFRQLSGLSGGGYGVDYDGSGSAAGATAFSTPLGYTLGRDQVRLGVGDTSFRWDKFSLRFKNTPDASGKAFVTYGHTFGNYALTYSYFVKGYQGDATTNFQLAYVPPSENIPGVSVGVQDIIGHGGAAGEGIPGDRESSRSLFAAATYGIRFSPESNRLFVTAGVGTRRFAKGFASASYQVARPFRVWVEHDGYGFNEGGLLTFQNPIRGSSRTFEINFLFGVIQSQYPTAALTIGF